MSITKEQILNTISNMSVSDIIELITMMENKFGISTVTTNVTNSNSETEVIEEKTEFNVILTNIGTNKIAVIKTVRTVTGLGLKEAKDLVESVPILIKEAVNKEESERLKKSLEEVGASVKLE